MLAWTDADLEFILNFCKTLEFSVGYALDVNDAAASQSSTPLTSNSSSKPRSSFSPAGRWRTQAQIGVRPKGSVSCSPKPLYFYLNEVSLPARALRKAEKFTSGRLAQCRPYARQDLKSAVSFPSRLPF